MPAMNYFDSNRTMAGIELCKFTHGLGLYIRILPRAKASGKICADNVTNIKISNKLTPSINYFYSNRTYTVNF